jgi:hypothetical protein
MKFQFSIRHLAAAGLTSIGFLTFQKADLFSKILTEAIHEIIIYPKLGYIGVCIAISGGLLCFQKTKTIGWIASSSLLFGFLLLIGSLVGVFPDGLSYNNQHFSTIGFVILSVIIFLLYVAVGYGADQEEIQTVEELIKSNNLNDASISSQKMEIDRLNSQKLEDDKKYSTEKSEKEKARASYKLLKLNRPYESQLVGSFALSLGFSWKKHAPNRSLQFNFLQGSQDEKFSDFACGFSGKAWMLELKRGYSEKRREKAKKLRWAQLNELRSMPSMMEAASKCHWIGYGRTEEESRKSIIDMLPYWTSLYGNYDTTILHNEFVEAVFSSDIIGVDLKDFRAYMSFLNKVKTADETSDEGEPDDSFAGMIFHEDQHGNIVAWVENNIFEFNRKIEQQIQIIQMQKIQHEIEQNRSIEQSRGHSIGW